jgi:hypothetical protein
VAEESPVAALPQTKSTKARQDPKVRHVVGTREVRVEGKRKDRHYVLVYKAAVEGGVDDYAEAGYVVERYATATPEGDIAGPHILGLQGKSGQVIEFRGHVLMSISREDAEAFVAAEQAEADIIEKSIVSQRVGVDKLRGLGTVRSGAMTIEDARSDPMVMG